MAEQQLRETETTELKESWSERVLEDIAAFANHRGGHVWLGVSDDGSPKGYEPADRKLQEITNQIVDVLGLRPSLIWRTYQGKQVLLIEVTPASGLVSCKGRYLTRVGSTNREMSLDQIAQLVLGRSGRTWDALPSSDGLDRLDAMAMGRFVRLARSQLGSLRPEDPPELVLTNLGLMSEERLTNAAVLLVGREPQRMVATAQVRIGRFRASTIITDRTATGPLIDQLESVEQVLREILPVTYEIPSEGAGIEALQRREIGDYPREALRELVINALIHRDYTALGDIQVRIYDDRLEIWNPGGLPEGVSTDDLRREGHISKPRNPLLAQAFYYAGLVERWGTGTTRVIAACRTSGLPEPDFIEEGGGFKVVLHKNRYTAELLASQGLNRRQVSVVLFVQETGRISNAEYQQQFAASKRTAARDIESLIERGLLRRIGQGGPGTHYVLAGSRPGQPGHERAKR
jgi:ATP-dependent DNA helicase RecG